MNTIWKACIVVGVLALAGQASAGYTYTFSTMGYSNGQALEGTVLDSVVTLTSEGGGLLYEADYGGGLRANTAATADIYLNFVGPISALSITAGDGAGDDDAFRLNFYDGATLLGNIDSPTFGGSAEPEWYTLGVDVCAQFSGASVDRVVFDPGNAGGLPGLSSADGGIVMTNLSFEIGGCDPGPEPPNGVIPAPGALMLCAFGTTIVTWLRSRRMV